MNNSLAEAFNVYAFLVMHTYQAIASVFNLNFYTSIGRYL